MKKYFYLIDNDLFPTNTGIYSISFKNSKSNKKYIGSASQVSKKDILSKGFNKRWKTHLNLLKNNKHYSLPLQNACNKYGINNIRFTILEECDSNKCLEREQFYIDKFNAFNKGYNGRPIANNNLGFKQSEKQKQIIKNRAKDIRDTFVTDIKKLYYENKTTREISSLLNISRNFIKKIFKENNITPKNTAFYTKKAIFQYNMNGILLKKWDNINECSTSLNIHTAAIRLVTNGRCKHAGGFYFSLKKLSTDEVLEKINILTIKSKNVKYKDIKQLDIDNNIIKIWSNIEEIVKYYNWSNKNGIWKAILKKDYSKKGFYKGFYWSL